LIKLTQILQEGTKGLVWLISTREQQNNATTHTRNLHRKPQNSTPKTRGWCGPLDWRRSRNPCTHSWRWPARPKHVVLGGRLVKSFSNKENCKNKQNCCIQTVYYPTMENAKKRQTVRSFVVNSKGGKG
jgi:hypothetical protein